MRVRLLKIMLLGKDAFMIRFGVVFFYAEGINAKTDGLESYKLKRRRACYGMLWAQSLEPKQAKTGHRESPYPTAVPQLLNSIELAEFVCPVIRTVYERPGFVKRKHFFA